MPVMDGVTATRILRAGGLSLPVVGVTGNALDEDIRSFIGGGANEILVRHAASCPVPPHAPSNVPPPTQCVSTPVSSHIALPAALAAADFTFFSVCDARDYDRRLSPCRRRN